MGSVYILKDPVYDESASKINNFTLEWIKWYRFAKIAPKEHEIKSDDIIIINLNDGVDPCLGYRIHPSAKRVYVVHKINRNNLLHLENANFIIYINDVIRQIAEVGGIKKPYISCPRYPLYNFFGTKLIKEDFVHIGGWFFDDRVDGLSDALQKMHEELHRDIQFHYYFIWGSVESRKEKILDFLGDMKKKHFAENRTHSFPTIENPFNIGLYSTRIAKYGFIHRNTLSIEETFDLINDKNDSILDHDVSESSMLSMYQSSGCEVIANNTIDCLPFFQKTDFFTFKDFAKNISYAIKKLS